MVGWGSIQKMDKPYQDNGNVFFKTFCFFNDKMISGHHPDPEKGKILQSKSCPKQTSFLSFLSFFFPLLDPVHLHVNTF